MCCFSQRVDLVSDTSIYARRDDATGPQVLVYSMTYAARNELAMVLPLPVPPNPPDDAVRFISLEGYPRFFDDLRAAFVDTTAMPVPDGTEIRLVLGGPTLSVHSVGSFEASFVPRPDDFERLDERFRIPPQVWDELPIYRDYGFAVFKLKAGRGRRSAHPMAFEFPPRNPGVVYFPTVHVHARRVDRSASFDHVLYCQADPLIEKHLEGWQRSAGLVSEFVDVDRAGGVVSPDRHCWRLPLGGRRENRDTVVGEAGSVPALSER